MHVRPVHDEALLLEILDISRSGTVLSCRVNKGADCWFSDAAAHTSFFRKMLTAPIRVLLTIHLGTITIDNHYSTRKKITFYTVKSFPSSTMFIKALYIADSPTVNDITITLAQRIFYLSSIKWIHLYSDFFVVLFQTLIISFCGHLREMSLRCNPNVYPQNRFY